MQFTNSNSWGLHEALYTSPEILWKALQCRMIYRDLGGVGTHIPLFRFSNGLFGLLKALSKEYGPQHLPSTP